MSEFIQYDLGYLNSGQIVEVTLKGSAANVRLMDNSNFNSYRQGGRHTYVGGLVQRSPIRLATDRPGYWYVTVDMAGLVGRVNASVKVLS